VEDGGADLRSCHTGWPGVVSDTDYLDSPGISMLFQLAARLRHGRRELRLVLPTEAPIRRLVELTNVNRVVPSTTCGRAEQRDAKWAPSPPLPGSRPKSRQA
jgi:hypothetical protein